MNSNHKSKGKGRSFGLLGVLSLTVLVLPSCGSNPRVDQRAVRQAQAQAHATRAAYHEKQKARDYASSVTTETPAPPNEVRYFEVPVEAYVDEDGLLIESHKLTLKIIQP